MREEREFNLHQLNSSLKLQLHLLQFDLRNFPEWEQKRLQQQKKSHVFFLSLLLSYPKYVIRLKRKQVKHLSAQKLLPSVSENPGETKRRLTFQEVVSCLGIRWRLVVSVCGCCVHRYLYSHFVWTQKKKINEINVDANTQTNIPSISAALNDLACVTQITRDSRGKHTKKKTLYEREHAQGSS